jgi:hypothetical protein
MSLLRIAATLLALVSGLVGVAGAGFKEARTGISFPPKSGNAALTKLGVRTKGPIKVYAVGLYEGGGGAQTFMLKMSYGVGAQKMSSALSDALKPRIGDAKLISDFEETLVKGLPDGAPKGTELVFGTGGGKLSLAVNGKNVGSIGSKPLAAAFANIYCDKNAVCEMKSVGDATDESQAGGLITPKRGAIVGAALGFGIGKLLS